MRKELRKKIKAAIKETSILSQSKRTGIPYATLHRIAKGGECNSRTLDKIEKHFL